MRKQRYFPNDKFNGRAEKDGFVCASGTDGVLWCVAVKTGHDTVQIRDTKDEKDTTLSFSKDEWERFIAGVKKGEFDL